MRWLNADEITQPGVYLWKRGPVINPKAHELWPITIVCFAPSQPGEAMSADLAVLRIVAMDVVTDGVPLGPVKAAPGRFFGPIPSDDGA